MFTSDEISEGRDNERTTEGQLMSIDGDLDEPLRQSLLISFPPTTISSRSVSVRQCAVVVAIVRTNNANERARTPRPLDALTFDRPIDVHYERF
ncbi:hypothetical protein EVAR_95148_1 [Eumeta japonica]|uniref:Uncharacterized protein n=1 Tax=Eumeta variegata TaxID=151549 RepID=A0A4C1W540_EUMVA|nr:hypothetical protein EVAR_95148_1 [Eumeta japonica]